MNTTSDESNCDEYDKNLEIALQQQQMTRQTVNAANMFATYYCDTFLNKAKRKEPEVSGYEWVIRTRNRPKACYKMFRLRRSFL
jgi:transcriptional antiterminator Rof (Rho-off)